MSRYSRFPQLAALLSGGASASAISASQQQNDDDQTLDVGALENAMAVEVDKATTAATKAANERWSAVVTSKEGLANVKAAARMLNTSTMSAEDIIGTLGDLEADKDAASGDQRRGSAGTDRNRLAGSGNRQQQSRQRDDDDAGERDDANPDTRGANAGRGGERNGASSSREHRKRTAEARNGQTTRAAGGEANVRGGNGGYQPQH